MFRRFQIINFDLLLFRKYVENQLCDDYHSRPLSFDSHKRYALPHIQTHTHTQHDINLCELKMK